MKSSSVESTALVTKWKDRTLQGFFYWGKVNDYYVFNKSAPPENELALIYEVCPPVILFESRLSQNSRTVSLPLSAYYSDIVLS